MSWRRIVKVMDFFLSIAYFCTFVFVYCHTQWQTNLSYFSTILALLVDRNKTWYSELFLQFHACSALWTATAVIILNSHFSPLRLVRSNDYLWISVPSIKLSTKILLLFHTDNFFNSKQRCYARAANLAKLFGINSHLKICDGKYPLL